MNEWEKLLGQPIDSKITQEFLTAFPQFKVHRPNDGQQYVISKEFGIDLLFRPDSGLQGGTTKELRKCQCAFLYADGVDGHNQYQGEIPFGFRFSDHRQELLSRKIPSRTWKIGIGEVPVEFQNPSHDKWKEEGFEVSAHYDGSNGSIKYFIVSAS